MRSYIPSYELVAPRDFAAALHKMATEPGSWKPFAGGTDLMVLLEADKLPHQNYINIWNLKELRGIEVGDSRVTLGALTTYTEVRANPILCDEFPRRNFGPRISSTRTSGRRNRQHRHAKPRNAWWKYRERFSRR